MNTSLTRRYEALFYAHAAGTPAEMVPIATHLADRMRRGELRSDAALMLLTLYDRMIFEPYTGHVPTPEAPGGMAPHAIGADRAQFGEAATESLSIIFQTLEQMESGLPWSSHQVLRAIDGVWDQLSVSFAWG